MQNSRAPQDSQRTLIINNLTRQEDRRVEIEKYKKNKISKGKTSPIISIFISAISPPQVMDGYWYPSPLPPSSGSGYKTAFRNCSKLHRDIGMEIYVV